MAMLLRSNLEDQSSPSESIVPVSNGSPKGSIKDVLVAVCSYDCSLVEKSKRHLSVLAHYRDNEMSSESQLEPYNTKEISLAIRILQQKTTELYNKYCNE
ncbi:hypothetical protein CDAR_14221 [Caerostris darwini]|uniref:Uncharacterized protein n=1 Tax=Caerostris darwini TaxID=1538125 RepID=A0AAV4QG37_9ARAC|nr:hypothetical protein CDAR_14221 [Caerostris darwini]